MSKRILALLFSAVMLAVCLTACVGSQDTSTPDESSTAATTTTAPAEPGESTTTGDSTGETTATPDESTTAGNDTQTTDTPAGTTTIHGRPNTTAPTITLQTTTKFTTQAGATLAKDKIVDMDGYIMTYDTPWRWQDTVTISDLGDILWHESMKNVMEEYNCSIVVKNVYASPENVQTYVMAEKSIADIVCMLYGSMYLPALGAGYLQSWEDIADSPINLADARWRVSQAGISAFNGKLYGLYFDFTPNVPEIRHVVFANKTLLEQNGVKMNELYAAVDSKQWTWDLMRQYALATTKDTDNDGTNDTWGITGQYGFMFYDFIWSNGGGIISISDKGDVTASVDSAANIEAVSFLDKIINEDKIVYFPEGFYSEDTWASAGSYDSMAEFLKGNVAFEFHEAWNLSQKLRNDAKFEYVLLPIPMGPKAKDYVMPADNCATDVILTTTTPERATKAAILYNAWARPVGDILDYSEEYGEELFQSSDKKSMAIYQMLGNKYFLDYGTGVQSLYGEFNHNVVSSILWGLNSPAAALQGMAGGYASEIAAIFANAPKN